MNAQLVVAEQIAQELPVKSLKVAKSAIHAGFVLLLKSGINREFAQESLSQIFQKMSPVKS
jgi:signal-transduction protein with cAMP-binding, CBS, and nucleotidyltransferase domain